ncbi:keratin, type I cytoskeletal 9-like [Episyrphus balteatus]|uniref:keratin, type I cytoskeletal 9-like n=1 Tax=Episyrphus balteatus TaxID=286459 RepID=UPI0024862774|nr:keratin, type I cytoskeletal 9-like [Episyrphus balteatus]
MQKFFIVLAFIGLAAADVSHLTNTYLPPRQSSISYQAPAQIISSPVVSTYQVQQEIQPQITYSQQPQITYSQQPQITYSQVQAPSVEIIDAGYDTGLSGISGNSISGGDSGYYGNSGLISAYDSGISGGNSYQGQGLSGGSGYQSVGQVIGGGGYSGGLSGGYSGGSGYQSGGQLIGGGSIGGGGGGIIRTISAPVISNSYESVGTQYGSNGGYVYERRH